MFDIAPSEFLLVAFIALVVIGPKDLPKALRVLGYWVGRARAVGRQFRAGFDEMVREAELAEMEKKWKEENERIMREHPAVRSDQEALPAPVADAAVPDTADTAVEHHAAEQPVVDHPVEQAAAEPPHGDEQPPVMVERPTVSPSPEPATPEPATPEPATDVAAPLPAHAPGELDRRRKPSQADLFKRPGDEPAERSAESKAAS